jgi:hypothetical protein
LLMRLLLLLVATPASPDHQPTALMLLLLLLVATPASPYHQPTSLLIRLLLLLVAPDHASPALLLLLLLLLDMELHEKSLHFLGSGSPLHGQRRLQDFNLGWGSLFGDGSSSAEQ